MATKDNIKPENNVVDLREILLIFWAKKTLVIKVVSVFFFLGLIVAFTSRVEYKATCKLISESQEAKSNLGGLGNLAGLAGINLNLESGSAFTPELYDEVVNSTPFQLELIHTKVYFKNKDSVMSCYDYMKHVEISSLVDYLGEYTIGLPGKIKSIFRSSDQLALQDTSGYLHLSLEDWELLKTFQEKLHVGIDDETGIISVQVEISDKYAAAALTNLIVEGLTARISEYQISKARSNLDFIEKEYTRAKNEYQTKQIVVARFSDQNLNVTSSVFKTEFQMLQNDLSVSFEVFKGLSSQLEQAKIQLNEQTPAFTIFEPAIIPVKKSKPERKLIIVICILLGLMSALSFIYLRNLFKS